MRLTIRAFSPRAKLLTGRKIGFNRPIGLSTGILGLLGLFRIRREHVQLHTPDRILLVLLNLWHSIPVITNSCTLPSIRMT